MAFAKLMSEKDIQYDQEAPGRVSIRAQKILEVLKSYRDKGEAKLFTAQTARFAAAAIANSLSDVIAADTIYRELAVLGGAAVNNAELVKLACSIAGSISDAKRGRESLIGNMDVDPLDCWAVLKRMQFIESDFGDSFDCDLVMCNSPLAGSWATISIGSDRVKWWAGKAGLLGSFRKKLHWYSVFQLLDTNFILKVYREGGINKPLAMGFVKTVVEANRLIARSRDRDYTPCQYGQRIHCARCPIGRNECAYSIRPITTSLLEDSDESRD